MEGLPDALTSTDFELKFFLFSFEICFQYLPVVFLMYFSLYYKLVECKICAYIYLYVYSTPEHWEN